MSDDPQQEYAYGKQDGEVYSESERNNMYDPTGLGVHSQVHTMRDLNKPRTSEGTSRVKVDSYRGMAAKRS